MKVFKSIGDIQDGDTVWANYNGKREVWRNVTVLNAGLPNEEVLLKAKGNIYFISHMAISGDSWAEDIHFEPATQEAR